MTLSRYDQGEPIYRIDPDWYDESDRSLDEVLKVRMCPNHQPGQASGPERRRAVPDPETGELRFVTDPGDDPIEAIARCCATQGSFITPMMPLREAIFRVFLAKSNEPLTAEEVHDELRAWFAGSSRSRYFTIETIARLLETDEFYGISRAPEAVAVAG